MKVNGLTWEKLSAAHLAERIQALEERSKNNREQHVTEVFGRKIRWRSIAKLMNKNDPLIATLARAILSHVSPGSHTNRIAALAQFVQRLPYKYEYDTNLNRDGFLTIFNGGGDCNNLSILFAELMLAAGYDVSLLWVADRNKKTTLHMMAGVPEKYFPGQKAWQLREAPEEKWVPLELTGDVVKPGKIPIGPDSTVFDIEVLRAK